MIATAKMSGAEFDALPCEEGRKWELIDGDLIEMPSPTWVHQTMAGDLYSSLRPYSERTRLAEFLQMWSSLSTKILAFAQM